MGDNKHEFSREGLIKRLDAYLNKTLGEADVNHVFDKTKTNCIVDGNVIEMPSKKGAL